MNQFFAILKDSFREAVDGFVIYLMIALAAVMIILVASISFSPDAPEEALPLVVQKFRIIFPDRGTSTAATGVPVDFKTSDVKEISNGAKFVLTAVNGKEGKDVGVSDEEKEHLPSDMFRYAVFTWRQPPGEKLKNPFGAGRRNQNENELQILIPPRATAADLRGITDDEMTAFIKGQFDFFGGLDDVKVTRRSGVAEPEYQFDVELKGVSGARGWPHTIKIFFDSVRISKEVVLGHAIRIIEDNIVNGIGAAVTLMLSVVITSFFIPNLLRKGSVDLLISKPIGRAQLLVYKYIGGLTFIFLVSTFTIGGVWLALAARSGLWNPAFLLTIPILTFTFAILYAVSTLVAVLTRSAIASILISLAFMFFLWLIGQAKSFFDLNKVANLFEAPEWVYTLVDTINNILPRYKDLDKLTTKLILDSTQTRGEARLAGIIIEFPSWPGAIGVSLAFIAVMLALSCWRFTKRDF